MVYIRGHAKDYDRYIKAIKNTDRCAWEIWQTIQSNPKMRDKTSLLITNDHGRHLDGHKDGFASHGDMCTGCRKISLLAIGPDFEANKVVSAKHQMIEIAPTVAELLKIKMPKVKGKSLLPVLLKQ